MKTYSQAHQDRYVIEMLSGKRNGTFVEIGSRDPIEINNTYLLEKEYNWRGIMVEYEPKYLPLYKEHRPNSVYLIQDAQTIDYAAEFKKAAMPFNIDYLQIDLEVENRSTLTTLERLDQQVMDRYRFATVTFEHDIYRGDYFQTRTKSREIFSRRGYELIFPDVANDRNPYEDWWVHPALVSQEKIAQFKTDRPMDHTWIAPFFTQS